MEANNASADKAVARAKVVGKGDLVTVARQLSPVTLHVDSRLFEIRLQLVAVTAVRLRLVGLLQRDEARQYRGDVELT